ncbi:hypothetical protein G7Z17_g679 [Cylindrodendrum hubeiense]|uniref:Zn(2)-C6 fungal-type domain-containing protein n=1 Tax=Cylindrodendrum hubeiense TaxID=595255 RepID=A0A9P5HPE3_9HYPO|nr:hypothetical protein G7Z17_g679 [Cylindrodendrum hubeiense]
MPLSRKKSCIRCRDSKLSCDRAVPACSRCAKRKAQCTYDGGELEIEPRSINVDLDPTLAAIDTELVTDEIDISHMNWTSSETYGSSNELELQLFDTGAIQIDSSLFSPSNMFSEQHFFEPFTVESELSTSSAHQKEDNSGVLATGKSSDVRYLETRKNLTDCMLTVIIVGQLTSYPKMLIEGYQLPPFIKAPCHINEELAPECAATGKHQCLPKVLAVCAGLVQMFYSSTAANAAFVWDMIYAEVVRLRREYRNFSVQERLEASQAMTVFLLLQADDPKSVEKNDVRVLLTAAIANVYLRHH